jgi:hypothetical protein
MPTGAVWRRVALGAATVLVPCGVTLSVEVLAVSSGLRLGGWLPDIGTPAAAHARVDTDGTQRVTIWATARGFRPGLTTVAANHPIEIVFRTAGNHGCTRTVSLQGRDIALPVTGQEVVRLVPRAPGSLRYACGMGMYVGFLRVE